MPLSRYCLTELRDFVAVMASALPAVQNTASSGSGVKWNTLQLSAAGAQAGSRAQDLALWHMQARHYRWVRDHEGAGARVAVIISVLPAVPTTGSGGSAVKWNTCVQRVRMRATEHRTWRRGTCKLGTIGG